MLKGKFTTLVWGFHYITMFALVIPAIIYSAWLATFLSGPRAEEAASRLVNLLIWAVLASAFTRWLFIRRGRNLRLAVGRISPKSFVPEFEIKGLHETEYLALSTKSNCVIVLDSRRKIARCESIDFIRSWTFETIGSQALLTFNFNTLEFPSLRFSMPEEWKYDTQAKLDFLLR